jgi:hypothetical protein
MSLATGIGHGSHYGMCDGVPSKAMHKAEQKLTDALIGSQDRAQRAHERECCELHLSDLEGLHSPLQSRGDRRRKFRTNYELREILLDLEQGIAWRYRRLLDIEEHRGPPPSSLEVEYLMARIGEREAQLSEFKRELQRRATRAEVQIAAE